MSLANPKHLSETVDVDSADAPFVPDLGLTYPDKLDGHMFVPDRLVDVNFDENYPYFDRSPRARFWSSLEYLGIFTVVFFLLPIRYAIRIEGKENLKKNKAAFKNGAITVANHVFRWDFLSIVFAVRYRKLWFPAWKDNFWGKDREFIRNAGGIPIPESNSGFQKFMEALDEIHRQKRWIHVFPEGSCWDFYQPIRPFKKGAFTFAYRYNIPIIPFAFSYRKRTGFFALFQKKEPLITLRIGEPIFPDLTLSRKTAVTKLREESHKAVCALAGVKNNPYPVEGD